MPILVKQIVFDRHTKW